MPITLSSLGAFSAAIAGAQRVDLAAYTLRAGAVRTALAAAARAGAAVRVRLADAPLDGVDRGLQQVNRETVALLAAAGADAALTAAGSPLLHLKGAVVDGAAWLDDRNWAGTGPETIVRDTAARDVRALAAALAGRPAAAAPLATTKAAAQALELDVIATAGPTLLTLETESFGGGAPYAALLARARAGGPTRLIVAGREAARRGPSGDAERSRLRTLAALGAGVRTGNTRTGDLEEKLAAGGSAAWLGSANATYAGGANGAQYDWGRELREPRIVEAIRARLQANWELARPLR